MFTKLLVYILFDLSFKLASRVVGWIASEHAANACHRLRMPAGSPEIMSSLQQ